MSERTQHAQIAVVIATKDRPQLLSERSLKAVAAQTRTPDMLVVVDDSEGDVRSANARHVAALTPEGCDGIYIESKRSKGVGGSLNCAIDVLVDLGTDTENVFVAILDDDDSWDSDYLEVCSKTVCDRHLDMVATGMRRFESVDGPPQICEPPEALRAEEFLTGNPGIQGSNLFIRLSVLLAAGGFDEALPNATDRDLCIRLDDLGSVRYGRVPVALVNHFAEPDRSRLSTPGSPQKSEGLTAFWHKYRGRMNADQRSACLKRAKMLFGWEPPETPSMSDSSPHSPAAAIIAKVPEHSPIQLIVGVISSDPGSLKPLLHDLVSLGANDSIDRVSVLILVNGCPATDFDEVVRDARETGLGVAVVDMDRQRADADRGAFGSVFQTRSFGQVGIAQARTMLQRYLGTLMAVNPGSIGWVLDDDMRIDARTAMYMAWLPAFRDQGTDVLLGVYGGSSPNPSLNGLRVHLVDLLHNIHWLQNLPPDATLPDRTAENDALRSRYPDYYYDLSRKHTGHVEMPHWLEPAFPGELVKEAYARILANSLGILSGQPITRPLIASIPPDPIASAEDSVNRGGCCFILNHHALSQTPNMILRVHGREARRSDMIWAIVNRYYRRMAIKAVGFPIRHVGRVTSSLSLNVEKAQCEIVGSTLYAGLTEFLRPRSYHQLDFSPTETKEVCQLANQFLHQRLRMLTQSFYRMAGLRESIRRLASEETLQELVRHLDRWITHENLDRIRSGVPIHEIGDIGKFLGSLRPVADEFATATVDIDFILDQLGTTTTAGAGR
jgi:glycosyltransferase involved in cell wall biosynthesis